MMSKIIFSAPFVLIGLFAFVTGLSGLLGIFYPYSSDYYLYLAQAFAVFILFYWLARGLHLPRLVIFRNNFFTNQHLIRYYFLFMSLGLLLIVVNHIIISGFDFFTVDKITAYRFYLTEEGGVSPVPFLAVFNFFFFTAVALFISRTDAIHFRQKIALFLMLVLYIYLSSSRSTLFFISLISFYFYFINRPVNLRTLMMIVLVIALLIGGFVLIGAATGKAVVSALIFLNYLIGGSHALDIILQHNVNFTGLLLTFRPFDSILKLVGLLPDMANILPYFYTPLPTNVYTIFGVYILDYGVIGSLCFIAFFGFLSGYIEQIFYQKPDDQYLRLIYALNLTVLSLGVFHDYYLSSGITWMIVLLGLFFF